LAGPFSIMAAALLWSSAGLLIKFIPWHPMAIASCRSLLTTLVFIAYFRGRLWQRPNRLTCLSGLSIILTQSLFIVANKLTTAANAIVLQYTVPVFIILIGAIAYRQRPTRRELLAMIGAFGGIVLFFFDNLSPGNQIGNGLAIFTGLTFAGVFVLNNRSDCQVPTALLIGQAGTFLVGLPFWGTIRDVTAEQIGAIVLLGVFQLGLSYILFQYGIRRTKPFNASLLAMIEPIMNPVWVFLVIGEKPGLLALIGAVIVIGAIVYLNVGKMRQAQLPASDCR
jgi:drug/metabolite transporter (DMT)-like permease